MEKTWEMSLKKFSTNKTKKMKFIFFTLGALLSLASQAQKEKGDIIIEGTLIGMPVPPAYVYRIHQRNDPRRTDSAVVRDGKYRFVEKADGVTNPTTGRY